MEMNYCMQCGTRLHLKQHHFEGDVPYCDTCGEFRWPMYNTAVSMIVMNEEKDKVILIRQHHKPVYVLVAGYVNRGEDAEDAARREVMEELGLKVKDVHFNRSHFYPPTNTLMLNFTVTVAEHEAHPNWEVDSWRWFSIAESCANIKPDSVAQGFLNGYVSGTYTFPF